MSEPSQLYARLRISRPRFEEFLASAFPDPSGDAGVLAWLAEAQYYGPRYTPEKIRANVVNGNTTIGAYVRALAEPGPWGFPMPHRNAYDDATQTWTLCILDFAENYDDFIAAVAIFRAAATFKDVAGDDAMAIYGYIFESGLTVALRVCMGESRFVPESEAAELIEEAGATIQALMDEGAAMASGESNPSVRG